MNRAEVVYAVSNAYRTVCRGEPVRGVQEHMEVWSLGLDSLQILEMVTCLEQALGVRIATDQLGDVVTIGDLCTVLEGAGRKGTGAEVCV
ncbi:acyl carrier protein [Streptomyces sp. NPDC096205]|uniref:acyl carrier protein n=1 Tax=Streptomyces sp. NPDC096205 TaxID=3366081 RepID=UPI0038009211